MKKVQMKGRSLKELVVAAGDEEQVIYEEDGTVRLMLGVANETLNTTVTISKKENDQWDVVVGWDIDNDPYFTEDEMWVIFDKIKSGENL